MTDFEPDFDRLREVFGRALELVGGARLEFLDEACEGEPELRRAVEQLLRDSEEAHSILDEPDRTSVPVTEKVPEQIGAYTIQGVLGRGGMGVVYRAAQMQPRRPVALKVLQPGLVHGELLARFARESEVLGTLQHPGIASVYDAGAVETEFGELPYFAMELVEGGTLDAYADQHQLSMRSRCELVIHLCEAIHHAHEHGVIHRDLKPGNILVTEVDGRPMVKVLDFGIARCSADGAGPTLRTVTGQMFGTLPYMSPEQVDGRVDEIDARTDVYALGVVLYELLTGELPFAVGEVPLSEAARVIKESIAPSLRSTRVGIDRDLDTIVSVALAKEPGKRYPTAKAMAADLRRHLDDQPIVARPASKLYRAHKFVARNRVLVGGVVATISALLIGLVAVGILAANNRDIADQERAAKHELREALYSMEMSGLGTMLLEPGVDRVIGELVDSWAEDDGPDLRGWEYGFARNLASEPDSFSIGQPIYSLEAFAGDRVGIFGRGIVGAFDPSAPDSIESLLDANEVRAALRFDAARNTLQWIDLDLALRFRSLDPGGPAGRIADVGLCEQTFYGGRWLATCDGPSVRIFDRDSGVLAHAFDAPGGYWRSVSFASDDSLVAVSPLSEQHALVYRTSDWALEHRLPSGVLPPYEVAFAPSGRLLAVGRRTGEVDVWDLDATDQPLRTLGTPEEGLATLLAWSPRGGFLARAHERGSIWIDYVPSGPGRQLRGHHGRLFGMTFSADGRYVFGGGLDGSLWRWDRAIPPAVLRPAAMPASGGPYVHWSADSTVLVAGRNHVGGFPLDRDSGFAADAVPSVLGVHSPDLRFVLREQGVEPGIYDSRTGELIESMDDPSWGLGRSAWSPTEPRLLTWGKESVRVFDPMTREWTPIEVATHSGRYSLSWSPDGRRLMQLVTGQTESEVVILDSTTSVVVERLHFDERFTKVAMDSRSSRVALMTGGGEVSIYDLQEETELGRLKGIRRGSEGLDWHPDGTRLAVSTDSGLWVFDVETMRAVFHVPDWQCEVRWSPDGRSLAVVQLAGPIHVWTAR